jgi:hypothetical protein
MRFVVHIDWLIAVSVAALPRVDALRDKVMLLFRTFGIHFPGRKIRMGPVSQQRWLST